jgi:hypothetical protein
MYVNNAFGQNKNDEFEGVSNNNVSPSWINQSDWMPAVLNANRNSLQTLVQYYGRFIGWHLRGNQGAAINIDGVFWESPLRKWRISDTYSGLQSEVHLSQSVMNNSFSENGYAAIDNARFYNTSINAHKKILNFGMGFSNSIYSNRMQFHFNNDLKPSKWHFGLGVTFQQSPTGLISNGYHQSIGTVLSTERNISNAQNIGMSLIWNWNDQGMAATTVNEMLVLSKSWSYNPSWGWYHHQLYFPNTKQSNAPILNIKYQRKWNEYKTLLISNGVIYGLQSQSGLDWTKSADPRPDYYRYLPSYVKDSTMRNALIQWDRQHPENLQIQFDKLEQVNQLSFDKRAFYVVNQQNERILMLHGSFVFSNRIDNTIGFQIGANYSLDQIHYYNTIKDLLGGNYYYNYNSWMNDDGTELSFQNDILHPNRKIKVGERWGADYKMNAIQFRPWLQFEKEGQVLTTRLALGYGISGVNRVGYNQNGLYPQNAIGKSNFIISPSWDFKEGITYRFNGRLSFNSILFGKWVAPSNEQLYINPEMSAVSAPYKETAQHYGIDFGFQYTAPNIKLATSVYWKRLSNQSIQKTFYHDGYASFVYGVIGHLNELYTGVEASIDLTLLQNLVFNVAFTFQKGNYENDPQYQILFVNDLHMMESGLLHLNHLISSTSPNIVNSLSVKYQPFSSMQINIALFVAQNRPIAIDYYRRSEWVKQKIDAISWGRLSAVNFLPDNSFLNVSAFKTFQIGKSIHANKSRIGLVVNNAMDHFIPIVAYEQTRFDYVHFDMNKYAPKYLMNEGVTYSIHFQISIL